MTVLSLSPPGEDVPPSHLLFQMSKSVKLRPVITPHPPNVLPLVSAPKVTLLSLLRAFCLNKMPFLFSLSGISRSLGSCGTEDGRMSQHGGGATVVLESPLLPALR